MGHCRDKDMWPSTKNKERERWLCRRLQGLEKAQSLLSSLLLSSESVRDITGCSGRVVRITLSMNTMAKVWKGLVWCCGCVFECYILTLKIWLTPPPPNKQILTTPAFAV